MNAVIPIGEAALKHASQFRTTAVWKRKILEKLLLLDRERSAPEVVFILLGRSPRKIARMAAKAKLDGNWISFQLANSAPPLSVTDSAIAPSTRIICGRKRREVLDATAPFAVWKLCSRSPHTCSERSMPPEFIFQNRIIMLPAACPRASDTRNFAVDRLHRSLLGLYRPQSAVSCSTLRERAA